MKDREPEWINDNDVEWLARLMNSDVICDEARIALANTILHIAFATSTVTATQKV